MNRKGEVTPCDKMLWWAVLRSHIPQPQPQSSFRRTAESQSCHFSPGPVEFPLFCHQCPRLLQRWTMESKWAIPWWFTNIPHYLAFCSRWSYTLENLREPVDRSKLQPGTREYRQHEGWHFQHLIISVSLANRTWLLQQAQYSQLTQIYPTALMQPTRKPGVSTWFWGGET